MVRRSEHLIGSLRDLRVDKAAKQAQRMDVNLVVTRKATVSLSVSNSAALIYLFSEFLRLF